jgi:hypothetical protein
MLLEVFNSGKWEVNSENPCKDVDFEEGQALAECANTRVTYFEGFWGGGGGGVTKFF